MTQPKSSRQLHTVHSTYSVLTLSQERDNIIIIILIFDDMRVFGRQQFVRLVRYNVLILLCRSCLTRVHLCISHNNIIHTDSRRVYCYSKRNGRCSFAAARSEKTTIFGYHNIL